ncbi:MAG: GTPase ObgE [candidate division Zixibacteria bacterium CG_4_9_14_3_um_filter_46_8]|nr:MAG: GTPase ObgE [candidate division Zixibacteria bacterium CG_4_9_14_3_um_filter_46_8]
MFIDYVEITVIGGNGGNGLVSFRTEKYVPKGGPDGGDGGKGGNIVIRADENISTLHDFNYRREFNGGHGERGGSSLRSGRHGDDCIIPVPVGTIIKDLSSGEVIADLSQMGQSVIAAFGGRGGKGNDHFKSSVNRAPRKATPGKEGECRKISMELKLLADVGIVGLPNAGKSTLISRISSARPKIADYPFTTLSPVLGIVKYRDYRSFVMADIPGLVEGASEGKGLGINFLKHIERTSVLLYLIDIVNQDVENTFRQLQKELKSYNPGLLSKPFLVALNKIDTGIQDLHGVAFLESNGIAPNPISAISGQGLPQLIELLSERVEHSRQSIR